MMEFVPERSRKLLRALIEQYIQAGEPVSSKALAKDPGIGLSPATIRNIMADLEESGYLMSLHTSSGRVPTIKGIQFFIDSLLIVSRLPSEEIKTVQRHLTPEGRPEDLIGVASSLLSDITKLVGIVSTPRREQQLLRRVEFLPLKAKRVLVILVLNQQEVQNRVITTQRAYTAGELEEAANYLNSAFLGKELLEIRKSLLDLLRSERENLNSLMQMAIEVVDKAFEGANPKTECVLAGESNILAFGEPFDREQLRKLFAAFAQKQGILHLLDECIKVSAVQVFIGEEASERGFEGCSVVTSPYSMAGQIVGALGVIGPTRMPYQRVIPLVDVTAKLLSLALNQAV